jgi:hypothetical protein
MKFSIRIDLLFIYLFIFLFYSYFILILFFDRMLGYRLSAEMFDDEIIIGLYIQSGNPKSLSRLKSRRKRMRGLPLEQSSYGFSRGCLALLHFN